MNNYYICLITFISSHAQLARFLCYCMNNKELCYQKRRRRRKKTIQCVPIYITPYMKKIYFYDLFDSLFVCFAIHVNVPVKWRQNYLLVERIFYCIDISLCFPYFVHYTYH